MGDFLIVLDLKDSSSLARKKGNEFITAIFNELRLNMPDNGNNESIFFGGDTVFFSYKKPELERLLDFLKTGFPIQWESEKSSFNIDNFHIFIDKGIYRIKTNDPTLHGILEPLLKTNTLVITEDAVNDIGEDYLKTRLTLLENAKHKTVEWGKSAGWWKGRPIKKRSYVVQKKKRRRFEIIVGALCVAGIIIYMIPYTPKQEPIENKSPISGGEVEEIYCVAGSDKTKCYESRELCLKYNDVPVCEKWPVSSLSENCTKVSPGIWHCGK